MFFCLLDSEIKNRLFCGTETTWVSLDILLKKQRERERHTHCSHWLSQEQQMSRKHGIYEYVLFCPHKVKVHLFF